MNLFKKLSLVVCAATYLLSSSAIAQPLDTGKKVIVVYYSRSGNNIRNGEIVNLKVGNTAVVANKIHDLIKSDTYEIKTVKEYPEDYRETTRVAQEEFENNVRPELKGELPKLENYDVMIIGTPIWWGTMPTAVMSFLEKVDCTNKIILPYTTHEGSGLGRVVRNVKEIARGDNIKVTEGLAICGSDVQNCDADVKEWILNNLK